MIGWITGFVARRGLGVLWSAWKWWALGAVVAAVLGYVGVLKYQLNSARADAKSAKADLIVADAAIDHLKQANEDFAAAVKLRDGAAAQLKKDAENAKRTAERVQRELAARRELDRRSPDCAALLDRPLDLCVDVERRLRERAAALTNR